MINKTMQKLINGAKWTEREMARYERAGSPMRWRDDSDKRKTQLANNLATYALTGACSDDNEKLYAKALNGLTTDDAHEIAGQLIDVNNYDEFDAFACEETMEAETLELKEKFDEEYNGIDGHVYMAQEEFSANLLGQYADEVELRKIMTKELA